MKQPALIETLIPSSNPGHGFGCFITPLTDDTNLTQVHDRILQLAEELKREISEYVQTTADECSLEQGETTKPEELVFGNQQVLNWALKTSK